jgi:hypothetical protein
MLRIDPGYPVYIISKGRWESRHTARALERMKMPYSIVVEPQEYDNYAAVIEPRNILVLPFSNLGLGSIPAPQLGMGAFTPARSFAALDLGR